MTQLRPSWVRLNRFHTGLNGVGNAQMVLGALRKSVNCSCGANGWPHTTYLSPAPLSKWDTWQLSITW